VECRFEPASVTAPGTDPLADFRATWVETICTNLVPCCDASTFTADGCRTHYLGWITGLTTGDPRYYAFDPVAAEACLEDIRTGLATCRVPFGGKCTSVMRGLQRDGQVCTTGVDCAGSACGMVGDHLECGANIVRAALGQPCAESCTLDSYGASYCYGQPSQADIGRCYVEDGLFCALNGMQLGPLDGSGATCESVRPAGEACTSGYECAGGVCASDVCGSGNDVGQPCPCKSDLVCEGETCELGRGVGEVCDISVQRCAPGLGCRDGFCECGGYYGTYAMPIVCTY
jgi:hypothetical protein